MAVKNWIVVNKVLTLQDLQQMMEKDWDTANFNGFIVDKASNALMEKYILLPATERFLVAVYFRRFGLITKTNYVHLEAFETPDRITADIKNLVRSKDPIFGHWDVKSEWLNRGDELKGPVKAVLDVYTEEIRKILQKNDCL